MRSTIPTQTAPAYPADELEARATHRFADVNGLRLHMLEFGGEGRPIVLLHGVGGNAWMWLAVARGLERSGRVLAVDFRGYGESQWSPDQEYTTDDHVSDLEGLLGALELSEADVVGFSWGGLVGLGLAARTGRVRRLAIVDVPPSFAQSDVDIPALSYTFTASGDAVEAQRRLSPRAGGPLLEAVAALAIRPSDGGHLVKKHDPFFVYRWPFRNDDLWQCLPSLRVPTLVIRAAGSPVLSADVAQRMVDELPGGRLVEIPDCGHLIPVEQPALLAASLAEFLA